MMQFTFIAAITVCVLCIYNILNITSFEILPLKCKSYIKRKIFTTRNDIVYFWKLVNL